MNRIILGIAIGLLIATMQARAHFKPGSVHNRVHAVNVAFCHSLKPCPLGSKAVRVARCESGPNLWPWAHNGPLPPAQGTETYMGMFQFGSYARSRFGFAWNPWAQARAAYRYWRESGWAPWECA